MKNTVFVILTVGALAGAAFAQPPADVPPEKAAVIANDRAYEAAYAKADVKALADFYAEDAEYTADDGRTFSGRGEIEGAIREGLRANKGAKLSIAVNTVKVFAPEVVMEKGSTTVTAKDGTTSGALYTAIHVKKDGQWKMSQLVETPLPVETPHEHLAELEWLLGEWEDTDKNDDVTVRSQYMWARGGNFLTKNVTVKQAGSVTLEGWQIIGWDPIEEHIRSWTFDGAGGYSEGAWTHEGNRWLLRETGIAPDGSRNGSDVTITKVSADQCTWESTNRTVDGEPQPSIGRIEISRVKGN